VEKVKKPEIRDGFRFRAGHVALDLAGTLAARLKPSPRELLAHPSDLARWLVAAELTDAIPEVTQADVGFARTLRESIYSLALAHIHRKALPDEARRKLIDSQQQRPLPRNLAKTAGFIFQGNPNNYSPLSRGTQYSCLAAKRERAYVNVKGRAARFCFSILRARARDDGVPCPAAAINPRSLSFADVSERINDALR